MSCSAASRQRCTHRGPAMPIESDAMPPCDCLDVRRLGSYPLHLDSRSNRHLPIRRTARGGSFRVEAASPANRSDVAGALAQSMRTGFVYYKYLVSGSRRACRRGAVDTPTNQMRKAAWGGWQRRRGYGLRLPPGQTRIRTHSLAAVAGCDLTAAACFSSILRPGKHERNSERITGAEVTLPSDGV